MTNSPLYEVKMLLKQIGEGNEIAFRAIFDHYKAPFHAAAFKMTRSSEMAKEIVQETFILLWNKRTNVAEARDPESYLFKILHNEIYKQFRKMALERKLKAHIEQAVHNEDDNPVEQLLLAKENREILENILSNIPAQQQLVYRLSKQEGLSRQEIADKLNISPNTVKNHLANAMEFIRKYFQKGASALIWFIIFGLK